MAHYRKIDTQIWNDRKFNQLGSDSKLVFFFLLSHPHLTSLGAMRATLPGLACELGWPLDRFEEAFQELSESEMVCHDQSACFIWLPNFLKYNQPESPNVVKSWEMAWSNLPECDLKCLLGQALTTFLKTLPATFQEALPDCFSEASLSLMKGLSKLSERVTEKLSEGLLEAFRKTPLNQEQQEQEQKERKILQENNLVKKENIEVIKNIVAPARKKTHKSSDSHADVFLERTWHNLPDCGSQSVLTQHCASFLETRPAPVQEALPNCFGETNISLEKGLAKTSGRVTVRLSEGLPEAFRKTSLNQEQEQEQKQEQEQELKQKLKQKQEQKQEQKEREILQENNLVKKENIEVIKNIVAPTRPKMGKPTDSDVFEVFHYWQHTLNHPQAVLDTKRRKRIRQALAMGYSLQQLCEAILGCSYTPHNMGYNEQGQRYDGLQVILRDADQIDRFIRNAHSPPRLQNAADKLENSNLAIGQQWYREKIAQGNTYEQE